MCRKIICLVLAASLLSVVGSAQAAVLWSEGFEGPPTSGTLDDHLGWTRYNVSAVGYGAATFLGSNALTDFKGNHYHVKEVPGLADDLIILKFDMYADGLYDVYGGESGVGIDDGTASWANNFLVGPASVPGDPGYPGVGIQDPLPAPGSAGGGWIAYDSLNNSGRVRITVGGAPGVGAPFLGGIDEALTVQVVFNQTANTITIDILRRSDLVSLNPTFVIPLTAGGKAELANVTHVNFTTSDYQHPNIGLLREVDNISILSGPAPEFDPPTPDPMTWASPPSAVSIDTITMTATTATDSETPPVAYYFECTTDSSKDSEWQSSSTYLATDLALACEYTFRVKARDGLPSLNETALSNPASATTLGPDVARYNALSFYDFDETSGSTASDSRGNNPGTLKTTGSWDFGTDSVPGMFGGNALHFDGPGDATRVVTTDLDVDLAAGGDNNPFTISAWFKPDSTMSGLEYIMAHATISPGDVDDGENPPGDSPGIAYDKGGSGDLSFNLQSIPAGSPTSLHSTTTSFTAGQWVNVVCSYDGTTLKMYIDGILESSQAWGVVSSGIDYLHIGSDNNGANNFTGDIDEVGVWDYALSDEGISVGQSAGGEVAELQATGSLMTTFIVSPVINGYAVQEHKPLPITCQPGAAISMMACRGEYEPASFVIDTQGTLKDVIVEISPLQSASGIIDANAVDVRVVKSSWIRVTDTPTRMNMVLIHDPDLLKITFEDFTYPFTGGMSFTRMPIDTATLQAADVAARQQFWLTLQVPDDAASGTYTGTITVIAANASVQIINLTLEVPDFDLVKPNFEYSVYHATGYHSDLMRLNEFKNMVAHGCMNPNIYGAGIGLEIDGVTLDFTDFANHLSLRETAGMEAAGSLYIVSGTPIFATGATGLSPAELAQHTTWASEIVTWAQLRGYSDVYFMGNDEAPCPDITAQRPAWDAIHAGGGKIFAASLGGTFYTCGDTATVFDLPVVNHPSGDPIDHASHGDPDDFLVSVATMPAVLDPISYILTAYYQNMIQGVHSNGHKIFTYMDMLAGNYGGVSDLQRRLRGLGLYMADLDGTMTWSYSGFSAPNTTAGPVAWVNGHSFVLRGAEAPFDTLPWEAYREGYDDARYLATLQHTIVCAQAAGSGADVLIAEINGWLAGLATDVNLDIWRLTMADYIEQLHLIRVDINGDGFFDLLDFLHISNQWMGAPLVPSADISPVCGDGIVNNGDLEAFLNHWLD